MPVQARLPGGLLLPPKLDALLSQMRVIERHAIVSRGTAASCLQDEHRLAHWLTGLWRGHALRLLMCVDCESVEVRDVTRSVLPTVGQPTLNRPNDLWGWYSGARAAGRVHL
jgi:hypothetical protein